MVLTLVDKLFYGYNARAMSFFFNSGLEVNISPEGKKLFSDNVRFYLFATLLNSILLRTAQELGSSTVIDHSGLGWKAAFYGSWIMLADSAGSAIRGQIAKGPFQFYLKRFQEKFEKTPWLVISGMAAWGTLWTAAQIGDIYEWKTTVQTSFGIVPIDIRKIMLGLTLGVLGRNFLIGSYRATLDPGDFIARITHPFRRERVARCEISLITGDR
jgi:hypothetical protein